MAKKKSIKQKLIIAAVVAGALLLIVGSFFLRDIMLKAGLVELERNEILSVKTKYSASIEKITDVALQGDDLTVSVKHGGLFEKAQLTYTNAERLGRECAEEVSVLCHTYCHRIEKTGCTVIFSFNKSFTKQLVYSEAETDEKGYEPLGDGWYYYEKPQDSENSQQG